MTSNTSTWDDLATTTADGVVVPALGLPGGPVASVRPQRSGGWEIRQGDATELPAGTSVDELVWALQQGGELTLTVSDEFFESIAKLRAARVLAAPAEVSIHAVVTTRMYESEDINANILRATIAAFAAAVGGADAITVPPHENSDLGRRIAENIQHILLDESHLGVVADPAGGSYAIEAVTAGLVDAVKARLEGAAR